MDGAGRAAPARDAGDQADEPRDGGSVRMSPTGVPDRAVSKFAAVIARAAGVPTALILLTEDGEHLTLSGAAGMPSEWAQGHRTPAGSTLSGLVLGHRHPIIIADITDDPRVPRFTPALGLGVRAYAGFPIRGTGHERILGVCTLVDYRPREWRPEELAAVDEAVLACGAFLDEQQRADTQRRFLDALLRSLRIGVAACDEHGRLVFENDHARAMSGLIPVGASIEQWAERHNPLTDLQGRPLAPEEMPLLRALRASACVTPTSCSGFRTPTPA